MRGIIWTITALAFMAGFPAPARAGQNAPFPPAAGAIDDLSQPPPAAVTPAPAPAEAPAAEKGDEKSSSAPAKFPPNPYLTPVRNLAMELARDLDEGEMSALSQLKTGFGMVRAIKVARKDVERATRLCGDANPGMKDDIDGRFSKWKDAIDPLLADNEKKMTQSLGSGVFRMEGKVKAYLDAIDLMAQYTDAQTEKNVVTTPEACDGLLKSMDKTQTSLADILSAITWPEKTAAPAPEKEKAPADKSGPG